MGTLADEEAKLDTRDTLDTLRKVRRNTGALGGEVTNLAADYLKVLAVAEDQDDQTLLDRRFAEAAAKVKSDLDALDANARRVVDDFFAALGYTKA